jgi:hypothetical protein
MSGKAGLGSDYTLSQTGSATIPANQPSTTVVLHAIADHITEKKPETATMTLGPGSGYKLPKAKKATVRINDAP